MKIKSSLSSNSYFQDTSSFFRARVVMKWVYCQVDDLNCYKKFDSWHVRNFQAAGSDLVKSSNSLRVPSRCRTMRRVFRVFATVEARFGRSCVSFCLLGLVSILTSSPLEYGDSILYWV